MTIPVPIRMVFVIISVMHEDIFKGSASAAASKFCEQFQVVIDVYIPHHQHQVKSHTAS